MSGEGQEEALERDLAEILVNHKCPCGHYFGRHHIDTGCTDMDGNFAACYCPLNMPEAEAAAIVASDWLARRESEAAEKARASSDPIIRYADLGNGPEFDEFIAHNATVHVEAMGRTSWWIGVDLPDGRTWHINLGAMNERAKFYARCDDVTCYPRADSVAQGQEETP